VGVTDASRKIEIDRYSLIMSPVVRATTKGTLALDAIFLFRGRTYMNQPKGLRVGLARLLGDMKPQFKRLPGGFMLHHQ